MLTFERMEATPSTLSKRYAAVGAYERLKSISAAAKEASCSKASVKKWVERHEHGLSLGDLPRVGRPSLGLDNKEALDLMTKSLTHDRVGPRVIMERLRDELGINASYETVRRYIKCNLARPLKCRKKPELTPRHKANRLAFATTWVRRNWDNVCVSDSKYFWLAPHGVGQRVWVMYGDQSPTQNIPTKGVYKIHAYYAAVSKWGKTKLFPTVGTTHLKSATKGVTGEVYKKLLERELIPACRQMMAHSPLASPSRPRPTWIFQQDNAKAHTCKVVKTWLQQQDFEVMPWPSKSPDLSWIENLWAYVANALRKRQGLTPRNFRDALMDEWEAVPTRVLMNMYNSIPRRLRACIANHGGATKY